jgi:hypothetical protein
MIELKSNMESKDRAEEAATDNAKAGEKLDWETPKLEDVSEQVMAQPYIRFT